MRICFAAGLLAATLTAHAADVMPRLDAAIPAKMKSAGIPSVSLAVIEDGKIVGVRTWGEQSAGVPATAATHYNIASLTKPISAEVVLRLASEGKLTLDEPMYTAWIDPDLAGDERHKLLTPRISLSHRTGFPNWRAKSGLAFSRGAPGAQYGYSGEGMQYVTNFAERKTGSTLDQLGQQLVFGPAGMADTRYIEPADLLPRIAKPHDAAGKELKPTLPGKANAADLVYTTAADYARFMIEVMNDKRLTPQIAAQRSAIQTDRKAEICKGKLEAACPQTIGFGLGWEVFNFTGGTILMHTGRDPGLWTMAYIDRSNRSGAVLLTNSDNGHEVAMQMLESLNINQDFLNFLRAH
jgi:CubicO group peptidase (beta-lactamase class C family)